MRIEIDIPFSKLDKRNIYVLAGIELIAVKPFEKNWKAKTSLCNMCGDCCKDVPKNWPHGEKDGDCKNLVFVANEYRCALGSNRPFECCISDGGDDCNIRWQEIKN